MLEITIVQRAVCKRCGYVKTIHPPEKSPDTKCPACETGEPSHWASDERVYHGD